MPMSFAPTSSRCAHGRDFSGPPAPLTLAQERLKPAREAFRLYQDWESANADTIKANEGKPKEYESHSFPEGASAVGLWQCSHWAVACRLLGACLLMVSCLPLQIPTRTTAATMS